MSDKVTRKWRKLHKEQLRNLNPLPEIISAINLGRMRLTRKAAGMEKIKKCLKNLHWKTSKEEII
jgi:hypothetical protein